MAVPFFLLIVLTGCNRNNARETPSSQPKASPPGRPFVVNLRPRDTACTTSSAEQLCLPDGNKPTGLFTTKSASLVLKAAAGPDYRSIYSWEPGKEPKLIVRGLDLDVTRLSDDTFAAWYTSESRQELLVTFDAEKLTSEPLVLPAGGPSGWQGCTGDTHYLACIGNLPDMKADDQDFDEMQFTAVIVIDLEQRTTTSFLVGHNTHFFFNSAKKTIYVTDHTTTESERAGVLTFDLTGKRGEPGRVSEMQTSPSGRFALTLQEDGAESWGIYDVKTGKTLLDFNCDRPGCIMADGPMSGDPEWNPLDDDQILVMGQAGKAYGAGNTCDVYQVSSARRVKSVRCDGMPQYDWSRDGRDIVTVAYISGKFTRQRVE